MATLIVFVHGFLGSKSDFAGLCPIVERTLTNNKEVEHGDEQEKDKGKQLILHIIRANFTSWFLTGTWDGADRGGKRVADELEELLRARGDIRYISVVGHSLGGIYARVALGILHRKQVLANLNINPVAFITIACPHVGIRKSTERSLFNSLFMSVAPMICRTTQQLAVADGTADKSPLIQRLTDPLHLESLAQFSHRTIYANITSDWQVPFCTASIRSHNPYRDDSSGSLLAAEMLTSSAFPHATQRSLDKLEEDEEEYSIKDDYDTAFSHDPQRTVLVETLRNLQTLSWRRVDVCFGTIACHEQILGKNHYLYDPIMSATRIDGSSCLDVANHVALELQRAHARIH